MAGGRRDRGQAAVELALVVPVVVLFILLVVQVGLLVHLQVLTTHAAREGARAAAVDPESSVAEAGAVEGAPLEPRRLAVHLGGDRSRGGHVTVRVEYRAPTDVPIVGSLLPDIRLHASATMRVE